MALARGCILVCEDASSVDAHLDVRTVTDDAVLITFSVWSHVEGWWLWNRGRIEGAGLGGAKETACKYGWDDGEVVLKFVEVFL